MDIPETQRSEITPRSINIDELTSLLQTAGIALDKYGQGPAKTLENLLKEVNEGESVLSFNEHHEIHREVNVLWVDVLCTLSNGEVYLLREDRQEFKDGRTKKRRLDSSIGEKLKPLEVLDDAVTRALQEELGVNEVESLYQLGYEEKTFTPNTFPGIESTYKMHKFVASVPESAFVAEGYVEYQNDKTNYYVWDLVVPRSA